MRARPSLRLSSLAAPGALLFVAALAARITALSLVRFPLTEGSAYYVEVARNLAGGRGLVLDSIWSYATPPLTLPRPAFELWQPLASFVAAVPMVLLGPTFSSAQLGFAILGALLAPLAWLIARDAAKRLELPADRGRNVALGAGLAVALSGPFVMAAAVPDSALPFAVFATAACLVLPAATQGRSRAVVALGVLAGLAYLTRMEAVFLGVAFLFVGWRMQIGWGSLFRRGVAVALIAAAVAVPWWLRNVAVFGTPLPGQIADNLLLTSNAQIFAFSQRPTLDAFLAQGLPIILGNVGAGLWHNVVDVLLVPAAAFSVVGLLAALAVVAGRRWTGPRFDFRVRSSDRTRSDDARSDVCSLPRLDVVGNVRARRWTTAGGPGGGSDVRPGWLHRPRPQLAGLAAQQCVAGTGRACRAGSAADDAPDHSRRSPVRGP